MRARAVVAATVLAAAFPLIVVAHPSAAGAALPVAPFHTLGRQIIDANGSPFVFRGVNMEEYIDGFVQPNGNFNSDEFGVIASWNASVVRIMLNEEFWLGDPHGLGDPTGGGSCSLYTGYRQTVENIVGWITSRGMLAMLDLHTNPESDAAAVPCALTPGGGSLDAKLPTMADQAHAPAFWTSLAKTLHADLPTAQFNLVGFDLFNEPAFLAPDDPNNPQPATLANRASIWLNGTVTDGHGGFIPAKVAADQSPYAPYTPAGMQTMYNAVRFGAPNNLVFISGTADGSTDTVGGYDLSVLGQNPVVGTNIVYGSHPYYKSECGSGVPTNLQTSVLNYATIYPVMFTEFGAACGLLFGALLGAQYMNSIINKAEGYGIGMSPIAWVPDPNNGTPSSYGLILNEATGAPSEVGQPMHDDIANH